jgi:hypothetical protein
MYDEVIPQYKERSAKGEVFFNGMRRSRLAVIEAEPRVVFSEGGDADAYESIHYIRYPAVVTQELDSLFDHEAHFESYDQLQVAVNRAWGNLEISEAQLLATLGEGKETIKTLISLLRAGSDLAQALLTGKFKQLMKWKAYDISPDAIADFWLEYRYALRPLVFDAYNILSGLQAELTNERFTARGVELHSQLDLSEVATGTETSIFILNHKVEVSQQLIFRAGVLARIEEDINGLMAIWGLDQPIESLWELVPFSFILDWFFTIGDVISAWCPQAGLDVLGSWCVCNHDTEIKCFAFDCTPNLSRWENSIIPARLENGGVYHTKLTHQARLISPDKTIVPSLSVNLDWFKGLDLAFIGYNLIKGLPRR